MLHRNPAPPSAQRKIGPGLLVKRHSTSGTSARKPKRRVTFSDVVHIKPICDDNNEDEESMLIHTASLSPTVNKYRDANQDARISEGLRIKPHKCLLCNASVVEEVKLKHLLGHVYKEGKKTHASQYFTLQEVLQKLKKLRADLLTRKTCENSCSYTQCATELAEDDIPAGPEVFNTYSLASTSTFLQPYETSLPQEKCFFSFQPEQCEFCGKTFNTKGQLKRHIKLHFNNEPETCEVCGKTFQTEQELHEHVERHFEGTDLRKVGDYCTGFGKYSPSGRSCDQKYHVILLEQIKPSNEQFGVIRGCQPPSKNQCFIRM